MDGWMVEGLKDGGTEGEKEGRILVVVLQMTDHTRRFTEAGS